MLGLRDLGFPSLILVACLVVPVVVGLLIRQKWLQGQAKQEEIKRLLVLAAEEAARAEYEASSTYAAAPVTSSYQCAVCYSLTTTRCAQCKAVRYCSGKCQIVHWRQGHREDCRPITITFRSDDAGSNYRFKAAEQVETSVYSERTEIVDRKPQKPIEKVTKNPALPNSSCSPEISSGSEDDIKVEFLADGKVSNCTSVSSVSSFSGFSTSCSGSESSDDVSLGESINSYDPGKSDGHMSADTALDIENTVSTGNLVTTKPPLPKFASLVNSVNSYTKFNEIKTGQSNLEDQASTSFLGPSTNSTHKGSVSEPSTSSSGFWERALNSGRTEDEADVESCPSNSSGASSSNILDSKPVLKFSFNLSGNSISPSDAQGEGLRSNSVHPTISRISVPVDGKSFSEKISTDAAKVRYSSSLNGAKGTSTTFVSKSREVKLSSSLSIHDLSMDTRGSPIDTDAAHVGRLLPSNSGRPNLVIATGKPSISFKSNVSDFHSSSTGGNAVRSVKSEKIDSVHSDAAISSHGATYLPNAKNGLKTSMWKVVDHLRGSKPKHSLLDSGSETAGRYKDKYLFPYDMFIKLYNWNKVELLPCGLINCGNSCYANSVLQCLAFTPPLTAYFLQGLHSTTCANKDWCFTCEFESLILKAKGGNSPLSPIGILSRLQNIGSQLGHGREEDAHEFLRYAIDTMQSVCLKEAGAKPGSCEEETTLIGLTFGGYLRSKIQCTKCQGKSERQERMMDLTVEIEGDIGTLEEALRQFTGTEILDGENKYYCSKCKSYEKAKKKLSVLEAPNVLTIALKRFQSGKFGKLNKSIRFPEILDLAPYMNGASDKSPIYGLCGVVVHLDFMNAAFSGHYVCYVKNIQNKWFKVDDSMVTAVELERVLMKGAYMLLYSRCSPRPPRCIRNKILTPEPKLKAILRTAKSRVATTDPILVQIPSPVSSTRHGSLYTNLQKVIEVDSSSDNSSLISSNSDEGSCSTRDSTSTDELSDYIFGDLGYGLNSPWRSSSDVDMSSSTSSFRQSPLSDAERYSGSEGNDTFLHYDSTKQCRNIGSTGSRDTYSEKVDRLNDVKLCASFRKSTRTRD